MIKIKESVINLFGKDKVIDDSSKLQFYAKDESLEEGKSPDLIVTPTNEDDIIKIISYNNEKKIPLIVSSSTKKYYGGTVPKKKGILLDLSQMNKILEINSDERYVKIEPGVTYKDLVPELKKKNLRIMLPLGYDSEASVVSTYFDRVPLLSGPKILISEGWQCILNMHLILANGMPLDTGTANWCKSRPSFLPSGAPGGPDLSRLFSGSQGTLGIVTNLIIKAKYLPKNKKIVFVKYDNLSECLKEISNILWFDKCREILIISKKNLSLILSKDQTNDEIENLKSKCPPWLLVLGIEFEDNEKYQIDLADLNDFGLKVKESLSINDIDLNELFLKEFELPDKLNNFRHLKNTLHIPFYINVDKISKLNQGTKNILEKYNYSIDELLGYIMPIEQGHTYYMDYTIHYDKKNDDLNKIKKFYNYLSEYILKNSGVIDRPYGIWADLIFSNNPNLLNFLKQIKNQIDPNNILNPGRMGL